MQQSPIIWPIERRQFTRYSSADQLWNIRKLERSECMYSFRNRMKVYSLDFDLEYGSMRLEVVCFLELSRMTIQRAVSSTLI